MRSQQHTIAVQNGGNPSAHATLRFTHSLLSETNLWMQYINHKRHRSINSQNVILLLWCGITRMCLTSLQLLGIFLDVLDKTRVSGYFLTCRLLFRTTEIKTSTTIILPAVLYGSESRSLTMGKGYRRRMFESRC